VKAIGKVTAQRREPRCACEWRTCPGDYLRAKLRFPIWSEALNTKDKFSVIYESLRRLRNTRPKSATYISYLLINTEEKCSFLMAI